MNEGKFPSFVGNIFWLQDGFILVNETTGSRDTAMLFRLKKTVTSAVRNSPAGSKVSLFIQTLFSKKMYLHL